MRTTLDLPGELMTQAMQASHQRSKTAVIIEALEELIRKRKLEGIKRYKGRIDLDVDLAALRKRR